jgi:hypothetical protein
MSEVLMCGANGEKGRTMMKTLIGRRHFMKSTLAGFGGFFFLGSNDKKQGEKVVDIKGKEKKFVYRTLGRTGLKLPIINMGVIGGFVGFYIFRGTRAVTHRTDPAAAFDHGIVGNRGGFDQASGQEPVGKVT